MADDPRRQRAVDTLGRLLLDPHGWLPLSGELRLTDADRPTMVALLDVMSGVEVVEWTGTEGPHVPYRDYLGALPCGLRLRITTDAELVLPVELPEGGGNGE